jgi:uncharacterized membrane protein YkoI
MKNKFYSFIIASLFALSIYSCDSAKEELKESDVPKAVVDAFRAKYPTAVVDKWESEKENGNTVYGVEFKLDGKAKEVHISPDGSSVTEQ